MDATAQHFQLSLHLLSSLQCSSTSATKQNFPELLSLFFFTDKIPREQIIPRLTEDYYKQTKEKKRIGKHSQVELLVPHRVEVAKDGLGPPFGLPHLDRDVGITGTSLVLGL